MKRRRNKFGVSPAHERTWRDKTYPSKAEMQYAQHLEFSVRTGGIAKVAEQPRFKMTKANIVYVGDFLVEDQSGYQWVVDVKGAETDVFKIKKRLWKHYGPPMPLEIVKKKGGSWEVVETIDGPEAEEDQ